MRSIPSSLVRPVYLTRRFKQRLRFHDGILFRIGVKRVHKLAAGAAVHDDVAERGRGEGDGGRKEMDKPVPFAFPQEFIVYFDKQAGRQRFDLETGLVTHAQPRLDGGKALLPEW